MFGATAISNIHAHDVEAAHERLVCGTQHVSRGGRTFEAVPHDKRRMLRVIRLPATTREYLTARFNLEKTLFIVGRVLQTKAGRPEIRAKSLNVALSQVPSRNERLVCEFTGDFGE